MSGSNFSHLHQLQRGLSEIASIIINITISANLRPRENVIYQIYLDSLPQLDEMSVEVKIKESLVITNMTVSQSNNTNGTRDIQFGCEGGGNYERYLKVRNRDRGLCSFNYFVVSGLSLSLVLKKEKV